MITFLKVVKGHGALVKPVKLNSFDWCWLIVFEKGAGVKWIYGLWLCGVRNLLTVWWQYGRS